MSKIVLKTNSREGWEKAYQAWEESKDADITFEVHLSRSLSESFHDVTELRFFFPIENAIYNFNNKSSIRVDIIQSVQNDDYYRIKAFISNYLYKNELIDKNNSTSFVFNNSIVRLSNEEKALGLATIVTGRIFPIIEVGLSNSDMIKLADLKRCVFSETSKINEMRSEHIDLLSTHANKLIEKAIAPKIYEGNVDRKINEEDKSTLVSSILSKLCDHLSSIDILAQIIWLYLLVELIETKELFILAHDGKYVLRSDLMDKCLAAAISYSEGLYQIIENACRYSNGKKAWFGLRVHRAGRNISIGELLKEVQTRQHLYETYKPCFPKKDGKPHPDNIFNNDYRYYIEFYVVDQSVNGIGMVKKYNEKAMKLGMPLIKGLPELFDRQPRGIKEYGLKAFTEDITVHYGLKLLKRNVTANSGYFMVSTPGSLAMFCSKNNTFEEEEKSGTVIKYITSYSMLIPVSFKWETIDALEAGQGGCVFGDRVEELRRNIIRIYINSNIGDISDNAGAITKDDEKHEEIDNMERKLTSFLDQTDDAEPTLYTLYNTNQAWNNNIIYIDALALSFGMVEILAKALFRVIATINNSCAPRIAISFSNQNLISEFVRLFSIFYDHIGKQEIMQDVQIALCYVHVSSQADNTSEVSFLLAGENINSARKTAESFLYFNSTSTLKLLPLIRYLTEYSRGNKNRSDKNTDDKKAIVPIQFPFDIYLRSAILNLSAPVDTKSTKISGPQTAIMPWNDSWFLQKMNQHAKNNLDQEGFGCKIENVHIRLGSKIHLNHFFETELLFHSIANTYRFAYLLASHFIVKRRDIAYRDGIVLLGYENYSTILVQQVAKLLSSTLEVPIYPVIGLDAVRGDRNRKLTLLLKEGGRNPSAPNKLKTTIPVVTIIPVGSTLSTVYKLHNLFRRDYEKILEGFGINQENASSRNSAEVIFSFVANYSLFLVMDEKESNGTLTNLEKGYWQDYKPDEKAITLKPEKVPSETPDSIIIMPENRPKITEVFYLLSEVTKWHTAISDNGEDDNLPLIQVDSTSTLPDSIFTLKAEPKHSFSDKYGNILTDKTREKKSVADANLDRLEAISGCVTYAHLVRDDNHFQFYFDFKKYFVKQQKNIEEWLHTVQIDQAAFNIIVSPLHETNSLFLKSVTDNVFNSSLRLLNIPIHNSFREDVRAKFNYIAEEYRNIKENDPDCNINIYYVDDSIVTGATIERSRILIRLILSESGLVIVEPIFKKVFLLINRSSYDTIANYVQSPDSDFEAYLYLAPPQYNTHGNKCPACKLSDKYKLLRKRSSTDSLGSEFRRLADKHKFRKYNEYDEWLTKEIRESKSYFAWLKQWLAFSHDSIISIAKDSEDKKDCYGAIVDDNDVQIIRNLYDLIGGYIEIHDPLISGENFKLADVFCDFANGEKLLQEAVYIVKKYAIARRDFMRLKSMHNAYSELIPFPETASASNSDIHTHTVKRMLGLISCELTAPNSKESLNRNAEWIISYVKILSRNQIAKYYHCRKAIYEIMRILIDYMCMDSDTVLIKDSELISSDSQWKLILNTVRFTDSNISTISNTLCPSLKYQIFMMLIHRMADLQSNYVFRASTISAAQKAYTSLKNGQLHLLNTLAKDDVLLRSMYSELPNDHIAVLRYMKSVKDAAMSTDNEALSFDLLKAQDILIKSVSSQDNQDNGFGCLVKYIAYENTQAIYNGINELCQIRRQYQLHGKNIDSVALLKMAYDNNDLMQQNMFYTFCHFWQASRGKKPTDEPELIRCLVECLEILKSNDLDAGMIEFNDNTAYTFEKLCKSICKLSCFKMAYIVVHAEGYLPHIISQSGYFFDFLESGQILDRENIDRILWMTSENRPGSPNANVKTELDGISEIAEFHHLVNKPEAKPKSVPEANTGIHPDILPDDREVCSKVQVIAVDYVNDDDTNQRFFIILQSDVADNVTNSLPDNAKHILVLREKLSRKFRQFYAQLINLRFDCSYVKKLDPNNDLRIMHLSDLHMDRKPNRAENDSLIKIVKEKKHDCMIDILAVTGDIVDGKNSDAVSYQDNYKFAAIVLRAVAEALWAEDEYLPHDWKRRIIITTGNHDYTAMNQLKATLKHRALASGNPIDDDNGTMVKFTYLIEFMQNFLDAPVDELIKNELNEVRHFRNLHLRTLVVNSSYRATPLRTNKYGLDREKLDRLLEREVWTKPSENGKKDIRICLAHYAPDYRPDYFIETYDAIPGYSWTDSACNVNKLYNLYKDTLELLSDTAISQAKIKTQLECLQSAYSNARKHPEYDKISQPITPADQEILKKAEKVMNDFEASDFNSDVKFLCLKLAGYLQDSISSTDDLDNEFLLSDERINNMIHSLIRSKNMSEMDSRTYKNYLLTKTNITIPNREEITYFFAGHEHAERTGKIGSALIYVADKFINNDKSSPSVYVIPLTDDATK